MNYKITIICLLAFFLVFFGRLIATNIVSRKLIRHLYMNETDRFDQLRKSKIASTFIDRFNLRFIDLSRAIMETDSRKVEECVQNLEALRLNLKQKSAIYSRCFYYYLSVQDYHNAKKYYQKNYELDPDKYNHDMDRLYDIYIKKGSEYLDETLEEFERSEKQSRANAAILLSKMYENLGNKKEAGKYTDIASELIEEIRKEMQEQIGQ